MNFIKSRINKRNFVSLAFAAVTFILAIVGAIVYAVSGANEFNPNISGAVVAIFIVAAVVELISCVTFKEVKALAFFLLIFGTITYAGTQGNYLANILVSIDGSSASPSLILCLVSMVVSMVAAVVSMITFKEGAPEKKAKAAPEGE